MKSFLTFTLLLFIFINPFMSIAQDVNIEITDLVIENNQLVIHYDITKAKKKQTFEVWPEITTANGMKINASSFSGDYGEGITAGLDKKIIWDYNADGVILNDKIYVEVKASMALSKSDISVGSALLLSAIVPGLGITKVKGKGLHWLMAVPVYLAAAGAITNNNLAQDNYNKYLGGHFETPEDASDIYNKALDAQKQSQMFTYSAIGVWALNMIWTGFVAKKNKSVALSYTKKTIFYTGIDPKNKTVGFTFKYRF